MSLFWELQRIVWSLLQFQKKLAIEGEDNKTYSEDRWQLFIWGSYRKMLPSIKIVPITLFSLHISQGQIILKKKKYP